MHSSRRLQLEQAILMACVVIFFSLTECFNSCYALIALVSVGQGAAHSSFPLDRIVRFHAWHGFDPYQGLPVILAAQSESTYGLTL